MTIRFEDIDETTDEFFLPPGRYALSYDATWGGGNVTLERLNSAGGWDGALDPFTANGQQNADLAGTYRLAVTTASDINAAVVTVFLW